MNPSLGCEKGESARESIKVVLVDENELAHHGVRQLLGNDGDIEVVGRDFIGPQAWQKRYSQSVWAMTSWATRVRAVP